MKEYQIKEFKTVIKKRSPRKVPDEALIDSLNIIYEYGSAKRRCGYGELGSNLPLNGAVAGAVYYELLRSGEAFLVVFTTRDSYWYDAPAALWKFITRNLNSTDTGGTVTTSGTGNRTITLSGTTWADYADYPPAVCQIKFETDDMNGVGTPDTWYTIATWDSATQATAAEDLPAKTDVDYVIRLCWSGDEDNAFSVAMPMPLAAGEKMLVATNGVDAIQKWDGNTDGAFELLGGSPNLAKHVHYFGSVGHEHTILSYIQDGATVYPQTIELSDVADPETWSAIMYELVNTNDKIMGVIPLGGNIIIYKEDTISKAYATGDDVDPLSITENIVQMGTVSINTVCNYDKFHIYLGKDTVYMFDGYNNVAIGELVIRTADCNMEYIHRAFAIEDVEKQLYCLFVPVEQDVPDVLYIYDIKEQSWSIHSLAHESGGSTYGLMSSGGYWKQNASLSYDGLIATGKTFDDLLAEGVTCDDLIVIANSVTYILGDQDGYVYEFDDAYGSDNTYNIMAYMITKDFDPDELGHAFKLRQAILAVSEFSGQIQIKASMDAGETWSSWVTLTASGREFDEYIANIVQRGRRVRFWVQNVSGAPFKIEQMSFGYIDSGTGRG